jgi:hypothetical protein
MFGPLLAPFSGLLALLLASASIPAAAAEFALAHAEGEHLDVLLPGGKPILRYMYARDTSSPELDFDTSKPYAHVPAPDGVAMLTKGPGGLFPHHRGIFVGWNRTTVGDRDYDFWHTRDAVQRHREFTRLEASADGAAVASVIEWVGSGGEVVIEESREHHVRESDDAHAEIDIVTQLTAVAGDVRLDGDPEHAGVQFRPPQQVADNQSATYTFHADGVDPLTQRDLPWVALTFRLDDQLWTVQQMSHPENPTGARWSAYRDYGRFGPFTVVDIAGGDACTFRYRFRITRGPAPSQAELERQYQRYVHNS